MKSMQHGEDNLVDDVQQPTYGTDDDDDNNNNNNNNNNNIGRLMGLGDSVSDY